MNTKTLVTTDGDTLFEAARIEPAAHWSTFPAAWFDRATAEQIAEWCNTSDLDLVDDDRVFMHFEADTLIVRDHGEDSTVTPDSDGLYKVGDGWAWEIA